MLVAAPVSRLPAVRRSISSLVIAAAIVLGGFGSPIGGTGVAHALDVTVAGSASATPAAVTETTVPDTTAAPTVSMEEDRTSGYIVMVVAVLVFVGGFVVIARRARKR